MQFLAYSAWYRYYIIIVLINVSVCTLSLIFHLIVCIKNTLCILLFLVPCIYTWHIVGSGELLFG